MASLKLKLKRQGAHGSIQESEIFHLRWINRELWGISGSEILTAKRGKRQNCVLPPGTICVGPARGSCILAWTPNGSFQTASLVRNRPKMGPERERKRRCESEIDRGGAFREREDAGAEKQGKGEKPTAQKIYITSP